MGAPSPDGFPALFYQSHWEVVGEDVTKAVLEILNEGGEIAPINNTFIFLIPKIKDPQKVLEFRPISLCNVIYKVVSKVLSNSLKEILPLIIAPTQSVFIPGRMILDNVIVAFETLHSMSTKGKGQQGSFSPSRGIRQGDPLSPYLFILVVEVLSSLLNHAEASKVIHGFPICRWKLSINHLFFTNDSLLFCRANAREWSSIHLLLNLYEEASGQKLNKTKTYIFFSLNTKSATKEYILSLAGTRSSSCNGKYLGLPALIGRSKNATFKSIIDRIKSRVGNWKNKFLSHADKEILLKAVGHLQNERKLHWVSWGQIGRSKATGGLGFRDLENFNLALLAKQGWRLVQYPNSLATQVLKVKYHPQHDFFQAKVGNRPSFIWRSFCATKGLLVNGHKTRIWKDRWLPQPTTYKIQSLVHILQEDEKVERLINNETKQWDRGLITDAFDSDTAVMILKILISSSGIEDKLIWLGTKDDSFTIKSAYHMQKESIEMLRGQSSRGTQKQRSWSECWKMQRRGDYHPCSMELQFCHGCLESRELLELFSVIARSIWLRRNKLLFEGSFLHPNLVLR
ncbi:uncharacterized protein LOC122306276 [Carya illinoinensis]|uniref:uncharacterized protein LOC122306276 n=1 Tax=Carya illinoinensis TaxID=32201 RepID=UPI001C7207EC|nr:uncharacterized protein LOC122306276 [Carya illinoinensis]